MKDLQSKRTKRMSPPKEQRRDAAARKVLFILFIAIILGKIYTYFSVISFNLNHKVYVNF